MLLSKGSNKLALTLALITAIPIALLMLAGVGILR